MAADAATTADAATPVALRCTCQAASHGSRQRSGMQQCAHIELALHCARRSFTSCKHHGKLGVHSKRARRAPGSIGTRLGYSASPHAARQLWRLSTRSSHRMSGYQRVQEVEVRQHAASGASGRRHSRPGRLRSNVFVHEDLDVSHEEIEMFR